MAEYWAKRRKSIKVVPRWISVKDALPEGDDCEGVLAVVNGRCGNVTFDHALELAEYDPVAGEWIITAYPEFEHPDVTHWTPLPELPGGGESITTGEIYERLEKMVKDIIDSPPLVCLTFSLPDPMQECVIEFKQITEED